MSLLIVGLGNPGPRYADTRHNFGFMAIDAFASKLGAESWRDKFGGLFSKTSVGSTEMFLIKPQTFMNLSGQCVQPAAAFWKIPPEQIVVLHDELDVPFGSIKLKVGGGHAGHNGLRSLIERLGTPNFARLRLGIGRPPADFKGEIADYVLSRFDSVEQSSLPDLITKSVWACEQIAKSGVGGATNKINAPPPKPKVEKKAPAAQSNNQNLPKSEESPSKDEPQS